MICEIKMAQKTVGVQEETHKVLDYIRSPGQSFDGQIKELIQKAESKDFKTLLDEAQEAEQ